MSAGANTAQQTPCPLCGRGAQAGYHPFCSPRCQKLDLAHWLGEAYVLPGSTPAEGLDTDESGEDPIP